MGMLIPHLKNNNLKSEFVTMEFTLTIRFFSSYCQTTSDFVFQNVLAVFLEFDCNMDISLHPI